MRKPRVLWLSNKVQSGRDSGATGTWLDALADGLVASGEVELGSIAHGPVRRVTRNDAGPISQWVVPRATISSGARALPRLLIPYILGAVKEFSPDLVHVWGTENYWGLLTARGLIGQPALLETQGIKGAIARVFSGGLTAGEQLACVRLKELLLGTTIYRGRRQFARWGLVEREIIRGHRFVTAQSDWLDAQIRAVNPSCRLFRNDFALRETFRKAVPWSYGTPQHIFCSAAYPSPFKGVHVAIRAFAILRAQHPQLMLRIAGPFQRPGVRQDGYVAWLNREARRLGIDSGVQWLGPLPAEELVAEIRASSAVVLPTFIEGYCLALAEAMLVGAPAVVSFAGGAPGLARHEESALFIPPGDETMCAFQLHRLLTDRPLAERIGRAAREVAVRRNDPGVIIRRQIEIYREVLHNPLFGGQPYDGTANPTTPEDPHP